MVSGRRSAKDETDDNDMSLFQTLDVSASGLAVQRARVEALAQNVANAQTTRTPEGGPYRRRHVVVEAAPEASTPFGATLARLRTGLDPSHDEAGVRVNEIVVDDSPPERRYLPSHPDAGPDGYVDFPPFNPVEDMVDLSSGVRTYQANLAVIAALKEMISRTFDISR
jgi:flagellar basal-body rod protein FlgC